MHRLFIFTKVSDLIQPTFGQIRNLSINSSIMHRPVRRIDKGSDNLRERSPTVSLVCKI